ncbi:hypothetical protein [Jeotgalicoccus sp. WY2]|uniref:hypothetical protein n=1 Tax=Jeotgalicoccus sp. WY2 TaxID=2708346 RepID=UPI001BD4FA69|nr:hypothetical protein [Jeotgalicoccus sp. WY2]
MKGQGANLVIVVITMTGQGANLVTVVITMTGQGANLVIVVFTMTGQGANLVTVVITMTGQGVPPSSAYKKWLCNTEISHFLYVLCYYYLLITLLMRVI